MELFVSRFAVDRRVISGSARTTSYVDMTTGIGTYALWQGRFEPSGGEEARQGAPLRGPVRLKRIRRPALAMITRSIKVARSAIERIDDGKRLGEYWDCVLPLKISKNGPSLGYWASDLTSKVVNRFRERDDVLILQVRDAVLEPGIAEGARQRETKHGCSDVRLSKEMTAHQWLR